MSDRFAGWESAYRGSPPPWDIGRPQPGVVTIASAGGFRSPVLDAGCGTGENALYLAGLGLDVVGLDVSLAIERTLYNEFRESGFAPAPLLEHLVTAGRLGRKTGKGFRDYTT